MNSLCITTGLSIPNKNPNNKSVLKIHTYQKDLLKHLRHGRKKCGTQNVKDKYLVEKSEHNKHQYLKF